MPSDGPPPARGKPGLPLRAFDAAAVAKAEAALRSLSGQFEGWMRDELAKLEAAQAAVRVEGLGGAAGERLYTHAHDIKGLGGTYGYPLVTRIAGSLGRLIGEPAARARAPAALVQAHVDAIERLVAQGVKTEDDPEGRALAQGLERDVAAHESADSGSTASP